MDILTPKILHEIIGAFGILILLYGVSQKDEQRMLRIVSFEGLLWSFNFALIGAWTAAATEALVTARYAVASRGTSIRMFSVFFILHGLVGALTCTEVKDLFVIGASLLGTYIVFMCRGPKMRFLFMISTSAWIVHDVLAGSISGALVDSIGLSLHVYRFAGYWGIGFPRVSLRRHS